MSKCSRRVIIVMDNNKFHSSSGLLESSPMDFDIVMMSNLIRTRRAMTYTPSPTATPSLTTTPTTAATALAKMNHRLVNPIDPVGHPVPHTQASSTSSMALPVRARRTHRRPRTTNQMLLSRSTTDASGTRPCMQS
ncbi:hypothetical protein DVH24_006110 [Malus domestica]|uniref:Uncharacterized protein n=1 Tax=Malus domestica TaxID=3750 RepID=A0A498J5I2_MALDO|nr:hypothetical protein DVH24_006110 [Malus domestica]